MSDPRTTAAAYTTSVGAIFFGLNANEMAAAVGAVCAIATFVLNWWYKHEQLKIIERRVNLPTKQEVESDG